MKYVNSAPKYYLPFTPQHEETKIWQKTVIKQRHANSTKIAISLGELHSILQISKLI